MRAALAAGLAMLVVLGPVVAGPVFAGPVTQSLRPMPRPVIEASAPDQSATSPLAPRVSLRPMANPEGGEAGTVQVAAPVARSTTHSRTAKGSVCGNPAVLGKPLEPIKGRLRGCGIAEPVLVTSVEGVALRPAATLNCAAANALADWVVEGLQPAFRNQVVQLNVADSYSCRPRNNVRGNPVSVHGAGEAIDIAAFVLQSGKVMTVSSGYGAQMRRAKKAACGTFTTTLGPGSDGYHEDHIHLDVSRHGGSPYCR